MGAGCRNIAELTLKSETSLESSWYLHHKQAAVNEVEGYTCDISQTAWFCGKSGKRC